MQAEIIPGAFVFVAFYFFVAGCVAEHSSANKFSHNASPLPSLLRGIVWPLVALKYIALVIWGGL